MAADTEGYPSSQKYAPSLKALYEVFRAVLLGRIGRVVGFAGASWAHPSQADSTTDGAQALHRREIDA